MVLTKLGDEPALECSLGHMRGRWAWTRTKFGAWHSHRQAADLLGGHCRWSNADRGCSHCGERIVAVVAAVVAGAVAGQSAAQGIDYTKLLASFFSCMDTVMVV